VCENVAPPKTGENSVDIRWLPLVTPVTILFDLYQIPRREKRGKIKKKKKNSKQTTTKQKTKKRIMFASCEVECTLSSGLFCPAMSCCCLEASRKCQKCQEPLTAKCYCTTWRLIVSRQRTPSSGRSIRKRLKSRSSACSIISDVSRKAWIPC